MFTISCRNVNEAYPIALKALHTYGVHRNSRVGPTLEIPMPVCTTYLCPTERVLFDPYRDANPFFHLFESFWILAGRNDVGFLKYLLPNMRAYSDKGLVFHGAYGYRLRNKFDQIERAIKMLKQDPESRRVVLSIWNANKDLGMDSKDIPCNDMIMLKIRMNNADKPALDMTVMNRSNDVIWGCYGANVVQFSILQEYIASRLGVAIGRYNQVSDSFHVYVDNIIWEQALSLLRVPNGKLRVFNNYDTLNTMHIPVKPSPMFDDPDHIDEDIRDMFFYYDVNKELAFPKILGRVLRNSVFNNLLRPMSDALKLHRCGQSVEARDLISSEVKGHEDWKLACTQWLTRRIDRKGEQDAE